MLVDLDGTIIIEKRTAEEAWEAVCCEAGPTAGLDAAELQAAIRTAADWFWSDTERGHRGRIDLHAATRQIVERAMTALGTATFELAGHIAKSFRQLRDEYTMRSGSIETLEELHTRGVTLALITNGAGPVQRAKIEQFGLARFFQYIFVEGELDFGKPDERMYRHALAAMEKSASEMWIVGDNLEWEVAVPQRLGFYAIWVDSLGRGLPAMSPVKPDRIIRSLPELLPPE